MFFFRSSNATLEIRDSVLLRRKQVASKGDTVSSRTVFAASILHLTYLIFILAREPLTKILRKFVCIINGTDRKWVKV